MQRIAERFTILATNVVTDGAEGDTPMSHLYEKGVTTMSIQHEKELTHLQKLILQEGALVEEAIEKAIRSFLERRPELAEEVIAGDAQIDEAEVLVEEECLKILALLHPIAVDMRFVVAILKMNNDMERMGDLAANLARRTRYLSKKDPVEIPSEIADMASVVQQMVRGALDSLINRDEKLARQVCRQDDEVDAYKSQIKGQIKDRMAEEPEMLRSYLKLLDVPRHLERIADLATNIAEDVIYMVSGEIARHGGHQDADGPAV